MIGLMALKNVGVYCLYMQLCLELVLTFNLNILFKNLLFMYLLFKYVAIIIGVPARYD